MIETKFILKMSNSQFNVFNRLIEIIVESKGYFVCSFKAIFFRNRCSHAISVHLGKIEFKDMSLSSSFNVRLK